MEIVLDTSIHKKYKWTPYKANGSKDEPNIVFNMKIIAEKHNMQLTTYNWTT
jgi:hypothetical protein